MGRIDVERYEIIWKTNYRLDKFIEYSSWVATEFSRHGPTGLETDNIVIHRSFGHWIGVVQLPAIHNDLC